MAVQGIVTQSTTGTSGWIRIDLSQFYRGVGLICTVSGGTATYGVYVTGDRVQDTPTHINQHDVLWNLTASANNSLRFPCTAVALYVSALGTGASVTLAVVQANA